MSDEKKEDRAVPGSHPEQNEIASSQIGKRKKDAMFNPETVKECPNCGAWYEGKKCDCWSEQEANEDR